MDLRSRLEVLTTLPSERRRGFSESNKVITGNIEQKCIDPQNIWKIKTKYGFTNKICLKKEIFKRTISVKE